MFGFDLIWPRRSKTGVFERFDGHYGPVTSLSFHPTREGSPELSDLFLTTSVDWSVKLWSRKHPGRPLYSFEEASDYVYHVQWFALHHLTVMRLFAQIRTSWR